MKGDNLNIGIKGQVSIRKEGKLIYRKHNEITSDALKIIMMSLAGVPNKPFIDIMVASGDFDDVDLDIFDTEYDPTEGSITFIATAFEGSFDGTLTKLELRSSLLGLSLAIKEPLSIVKDDSTRLQFEWKITITNC